MRAERIRNSTGFGNLRRFHILFPLYAQIIWDGDESIEV